ncbi:MAG: hypothetical protein ABR556_11545 [Pyrinomonadaceae bacterium]
MKSKFPVQTLLILLVFPLVSVQVTYATTNPEALARQAVSKDAAESATAISELRAIGPAGLNVLFRVYADEINSQVSNPLLAATPEWRRLSAALDMVSQQKDSYLSGLYWYTDFGQAKAVARASGKPILSLRLLGKLNEEFSCANSRFFRTTLYSNAEMSNMLRERFILHWQSVRPAPRVTIDFGDGRKLERTLTGNSIHYVLDSEGRPIDALPGLYGFWPFLRGLEHAEGIFKQLQGMNDEARRVALANYHRGRIDAITSAWAVDTGKYGGKVPESLLARIVKGSPNAVQIAPVAVTKMVVEVNILNAIMRDANVLSRVTDEAAWKKIAALHANDGLLDLRSQSLIRRQSANLFATPGSSAAAEALFSRVVDNFQRSIALDTVRNEYVLHTKLHAWLIADPSRDDVNALNEKVYAELFLTPRSDPWLGLLSADNYTALESGGVIA